MATETYGRCYTNIWTVALIKANRFNHLPSEWSFGEGSVPGDQRSRVSCSRIWRNSLKVTIRTP
jgi:hypothetical protein